MLLHICSILEALLLNSRHFAQESDKNGIKLRSSGQYLVFLLIAGSFSLYFIRPISNP